MLVAVLALSAWSGTDSIAAQQVSVVAGGGKNLVIVTNMQDTGTQIRGHIQVNRIPGPRAAPSNVALATSSCSQCQTLAVAVQVNFISRTAGVIAPENVAVASNVGCTSCATVAWAIQYVVQVDDPTKELTAAEQSAIARLHQVLAGANSAQSICDAVGSINAVISTFVEIAVPQEIRDAKSPNPIPCIG